MRSAALQALAGLLRPKRRLPPLVTVPEVTGLSAIQAEEALVSAGLRFELAQLSSHPPPVMGTVVGQDPGPGTTLHRGTAVTITVLHPPWPNPEAARAIG